MVFYFAAASITAAAAAAVLGLALFAASDRDRAFAALWRVLRGRSHAALAPLRRGALALALGLPGGLGAGPPLPPPGAVEEALEIGAGFGDCAREVVAAVAAARARAPAGAAPLRRLTLVEPNAQFHAALRGGGVAAAAAPAAVRVLGCGGEALAAAGVADGSVDLVFVHLVLCSCPSQAAVLAAARRALRPGGRLVCVEHVGAPGGGLARWTQRLIALSGAWALFGGGCRLDCDTAAALAAAGPWARLEVVQADVQGLPFFLRPHIAAVAVR
jgi:SAM-dependent methyltransferase